MKKHRVFIGFFEVAGIFAGLKEGLLELGHTVSLCEIEPHPFDYQKNTDFESWFALRFKAWLRSSLGLNVVSSNKLIPRVFRRIMGELCCLILAIRYDVFIFSGGISFADAFDVSRKPFVFRLLRRRWFFLFTGTDSRAPYCGRNGYESRGELVFLRDLENMIAAKSACVEKAEATGDVLIDFPSNAHFHSKPFISFLHMGIPVSEVCQRPEPAAETPIRILHAPSNERIKGSEAIRMVLGKLRKEGFVFEYVEVKNASNNDVLDLLQETDLVIDQIYSDSPMAGLASEAAAAGVVSIVGGYFWGLLADLQDYSPPPVIQCHPLHLYYTVKAAIQTSQKELYNKGYAARLYVRDNFSQKQYATRILDCIKREISEKCVIQPATMSYGLGCGMDLLETTESVKALFVVSGSDSLGLPVEQSYIRSFYKNMGEGKGFETEEFVKLKKMLPQPIFDKLCGLLAKNIKFSVLLRERGLSENTSEWQFIRDKLENFRGMIQRRDMRIIKLEKKLKIEKPRDLKGKKKAHAGSVRCSGSARVLEQGSFLAELKSGSYDIPPTVEVVIFRLEQRNLVLSQLARGERQSYRGEEILKMKRKLNNFRGMVCRRDERILKLEGRLKGRRK